MPTLQATEGKFVVVASVIKKPLFKFVLVTFFSSANSLSIIEFYLVGLRRLFCLDAESLLAVRSFFICC